MEDEFHLLMVCPLYITERIIMLNKIYDLFSNTKAIDLRGRYSIDNTKLLPRIKIGWIKCSFLKFSQIKDMAYTIRVP